MCRIPFQSLLDLCFGMDMGWDSLGEQWVPDEALCDCGGTRHPSDGPPWRSGQFLHSGVYSSNS